jgi:hypothetical protein
VAPSVDNINDFKSPRPPFRQKSRSNNVYA